MGLQVDSHMHVNLNGFNSEKIIKYMDQNSIDLSWLLTWEEHSPDPFSVYKYLTIEEIFLACNQYPSRFIPMYAPDPSREGACRDLKKWYKLGIKGMGELKVRMPWDSVCFDAFFSLAEELKLPLVFHMQSGRKYFRPAGSSALEKLICTLSTRTIQSKFPQITLEYILNHSDMIQRVIGERYISVKGYLNNFTSLECRLQQFPSLPFIGHGPLFWKSISADISGPTYDDRPIKDKGIICRLLEKYPNLYADLSGPSGYNAINRDLSFSKYFLTDYSHKILYGTDNYSLGLKGLLERLNLGSLVRRRILGENAIRLIRI